MKRGWLGLAVAASIVLGGCAHAPSPKQMQSFYNAPSDAYTLSLSSPAIIGSVSMTEQCEPYGGSVNLWDSKNRFFRIDYLNFIEHPVVRSPSFANDRALNDTVNSTMGEGLLTILSLEMNKDDIPQDTLDNTVYYGFFIFRRGDFAYIVQHRQEIYQPERMKAMLVTLAESMSIPGKNSFVLNSGSIKSVDKMFNSDTENEAWKKTMLCASKK